LEPIMSKLQTANRDEWRAGRPATPEVQAELRALVATHGELEAERLLGLPRGALMRALSGLGQREGTHTLIETRLAALRRSEAA
jgi:hypothetical protein